MPPDILIVDDEPILATVLAELLDSEGFVVRTAPNGAVALAEHTRLPADVILSDVMMPVVDGPTLVNELRRRGDSTPVVLLSAAPQRGERPPNVPFVPKPFDIDELLRVLNTVLMRSGRSDESSQHHVG